MGKTKSNKTKPKSKGKGKKVFAILLCVLLLAVLAASITFNVLLYKKVSVLPDSDPPLDSGNVIVKPSESAYLRMSPAKASIASDSDGDYITIPMTVTPEIDETIFLKWEMGFTNPNAEWAQGKSIADYATLTQVDERKANVKILQLFCEQITVTASLIDKPDVNISSTIDYERRYKFDGFDIKATSNALNEYGAVFTPKLTKMQGSIDVQTKKSMSIKPNYTYVRFIDEVIYPAMRSRLEGMGDISAVKNRLITYAETGTSSLSSGIYGILNNEKVSPKLSVTFINPVANPKYSVYMQRLFGLYAVFDQTLLNAPIENCEQFVRIHEDIAKALSDTCAIINRKVMELEGGTEYMQRIDQNVFMIPDAFTVTFKLESENYTIEQSLLLPFVFTLLPSLSNSLEIDPPSIIV